MNMLDGERIMVGDKYIKFVLKDDFEHNMNCTKG